MCRKGSTRSPRSPTCSPRPEWHLIGPLQSNKTRAAAEHFDWVHSVDRLKIAERLSAQRPDGRGAAAGLPAGQHQRRGQQERRGPGEVAALALAVAALPRLRLRGLMAIPEPLAGFEAQRAPHRALRGCSRPLRARWPGARHAVDGHERRPRGGDRRRRDPGARGHRDLRGAARGGAAGRVTRAGSGLADRTCRGCRRLPRVPRVPRVRMRSAAGVFARWPRTARSRCVHCAP